MVNTRKFSDFSSGGTLAENNSIAGLFSSTNVLFTTPTQFLEPGPTADRPSIPTDGMIRYNTDLSQFEYYNGSVWAQLESSGDIANLVAELASHVLGEGASMIGLENQGIVSGKTVQDLAEADILVKTDVGELVNGFAVSSLSTGLMTVETGTGNLNARAIAGTTNQINVNNGNGLAGNPTISFAVNPQLPGNSYVVIPSGTTANRPVAPANGYIRYNTDTDTLEYWNNNTFVWVSLTATSGGITWANIAGTSQSASVNFGYVCTNAATTTVSLPALASLGDIVRVEGLGAGGWILEANVGQTIQIGSGVTSSGGTLESIASTNNIVVTCIVANTTWRVTSTNSMGLTIT